MAKKSVDVPANGTPASDAPTTNPVQPAEEITIEGVLTRLKDAITNADPFTVDPRISRIRQAGQGLAEMLHKADTAEKLAVTLRTNAVDLARKALLVLADSPEVAPKKRGRPPGSTNKKADETEAPTLAD